MPYATNEDLPARVRDHLPAHAQDIFREAFNHAWERYADDPRREEIAFRVAWAAVKRRGYRKGDGQWVGPCGGKTLLFHPAQHPPGPARPRR